MDVQTYDVFFQQPAGQALVKMKESDIEEMRKMNNRQVRIRISARYKAY
ncbi:hypothetical protein CHCC20335_4190 [Bacillus paralicheniformis]|nr:hypothetical protein CHCC20335_4190 [Bacillus paralicheniformis]